MTVDQKNKTKRLYIHIGYPKTGTTTIQHFLDANRELLKRQGVCYPEAVGLKNHNLISAAVDIYLITPSPFYLEKVSNEVKNSGCDVAIVSAEALSWANQDASRLRNAFPGWDIKIIVFIRNCFDNSFSIMKQQLKDGRFPSADLSIQPPSIPLPLTDLVLPEYINVFGRDNIIPISYEKCVREDSLIQSFCEACSIELSGDFQSTPSVNITPGCAALMFLYQLCFLGIGQVDTMFIASELEKMDLSQFDSFRCKIWRNSKFELSDQLESHIRLEGELLNDPQYFNYCMTQRDKYASLPSDTDLPPEIQHFIFNKLSPESRKLITDKWPAAATTFDTTKPILPSMNDIPDEYFERLCHLAIELYKVDINLEKEAVIFEKETVIAERGVTLAEKEAVIAERDVVIAEKEANIAKIKDMADTGKKGTWKYLFSHPKKFVKAYVLKFLLGSDW